jgi:hypothetical protein
MLEWGESQKGHRHVQQNNRNHCHDGHRYWQEFVPSRRARPARRSCPAAEVITRPDRSAALQHAAVSGWHGSLRWQASPEPQAASLRSRCATDAREVCTRDSKGQKNDIRDAEAIAEWVQRPTMKFVATKTADQLTLQSEAGYIDPRPQSRQIDETLTRRTAGPFRLRWQHIRCTRDSCRPIASPDLAA